jgi:hypothetical protein
MFSFEKKKLGTKAYVIDQTMDDLLDQSALLGQLLLVLDLRLHLAQVPGDELALVNTSELLAFLES